MHAFSSALTQRQSSLATSREILLSAGLHYEKDDLRMVFTDCLRFLEHLPFDLSGEENYRKENFRLLAANMLEDGHDYNSAVSILNLTQSMMDFAEIFLKTVERKRVAIEPPQPRKEEAFLILQFCAGIYNLLDMRLSD